MTNPVVFCCPSSFSSFSSFSSSSSSSSSFDLVMPCLPEEVPEGIEPHADMQIVWA